MEETLDPQKANVGGEEGGLGVICRSVGRRKKRNELFQDQRTEGTQPRREEIMEKNGGGAKNWQPTHERMKMQVLG